MSYRKGSPVAKRCSGWITTLQGQKVMFTGKVLIDGEWTYRKVCVALIEPLGATYVPRFNQKVTLAVHGDLAGKAVVDEKGGLGEKLLDVLKSRKLGRHVHVVDGAGFSDLLHGASAPCLKLRPYENGVLVLPLDEGHSAPPGSFERLAMRTKDGPMS
ncbi:hypothetical protein AB0I22_38140 [Streptomyces sp. NPDC050610]|uniref:hypothetical protein n=1 Tax=Streptomyces sp. NPDC050610 TaxID=3157097 RepID=UPI003436A81D